MMPVLVHHGGDVAVQSGLVGGEAPVPRMIVVTMFDDCDWPDVLQVLDVQVIAEPGQRVRFPESVRLGWLGPHHVPLPVTLYTSMPNLQFLAFAADCWPTVGREADYAEYPTRLWRRAYPGEGEDSRQAIPSGACGAAEIRFYPRSHPFGLEVTANLRVTGTQGSDYVLVEILTESESLLERIDGSAGLSDGDRLMIYRQLLEVVDRVRPMLVFHQQYLDAAARRLRERVAVLCAATGQPPLPGEFDEAAWLQRIKADVAAHGIAAAAQEWMAPAVDRNWVSCVEYLLDQGADRNTCWGPLFPSPLEIAAYQGHPEMAGRLLAAGADPDAVIEPRQGGGHTALHTAALRGQVETARVLLSQGAKVDGLADVPSPLKVAAERSDPAMVRLLIEHGADVNRCESGGYTALMVACRQYYCSGIGPYERVKAVVALLLDRRADFNAAADDGDTPLHLAIRARQYGVVELLLEHGADANCTDARGRTPLKLARQWGAPRGVLDLIRTRGGHE